jgi:hypothetical protein
MELFFSNRERLEERLIPPKRKFALLYPKADETGTHIRKLFP